MAIKVQETVYHVIIDEGNPFSALPASMGMQKGDLITFKGEGNPVRLPVGGAGKFLVSDPATETGLKYANITDMAISGTAELKNNTGAMITAGTVVKGTTGSALDPYMYMIKATDHDAGQLYILSDDCATGDTISCYYAPGSVIYVLCDTEEVEIGDALAVSGTAGICTPLGNRSRIFT